MLPTMNKEFIWKNAVNEYFNTCDECEVYF